MVAGYSLAAGRAAGGPRSWPGWRSCRPWSPRSRSSATRSSRPRSCPRTSPSSPRPCCSGSAVRERRAAPRRAGRAGRDRRAHPRGGGAAPGRRGAAADRPRRARRRRPRHGRDQRPGRGRRAPARPRPGAGPPDAAGHQEGQRRGARRPARDAGHPACARGRRPRRCGRRRACGSSTTWASSARACGRRGRGRRGHRPGRRATLPAAVDDHRLPDRAGGADQRGPARQRLARAGAGLAARRPGRHRRRGRRPRRRPGRRAGRARHRQRRPRHARAGRRRRAGPWRPGRAPAAAGGCWRPLPVDVRRRPVGSAP